MGGTSVTGIGVGIAFPGNKLPPLIATIQEFSQKTSEYLVGYDIADPYSSIQAAINGAVAAGRNLDNPAVVLVKPGTYEENLTLVPGIAVKAVGDSNDTLFLVGGQTTVIGTVTVNTAGTFYWEGVDVKSNTVGFNITGSGTVVFTISDCLVDATNGLIYDNTAPNGIIGLQTVNFVINGSMVIVCQPDPTSTLFFRDCVMGLFGQTSDNTIIDHQSGVFLFYNGYIQGGVNIGAAANPSIYAYTTMGTDTIVPITIAAGGGAVLLRSNVNTSAAFLATGTGQVLLGDCIALPGYTGGFDPSLTVVNFVSLFTPAVPGDWSPAPNSVDSALDQLAARVTALGG